MERLVTAASRPAVSTVRCLPQLLLGTRGAHKAHRESFLSASSSNYLDEMYEQWSKDPKSVHKVTSRRLATLRTISMRPSLSVVGHLLSQSSLPTTTDVGPDTTVASTHAVLSNDRLSSTATGSISTTEYDEFHGGKRSRTSHGHQSDSRSYGCSSACSIVSGPYSEFSRSLVIHSFHGCSSQWIARQF